MERMTDSGETEKPSVSHGEPRCDFCGAHVPRVRRIVLDGDYERLRTPHAVRYACPACSARKERERAEASAS